jgi:acetylornithine/succinyldiaminopimelate/putrescine aminotransferase/predicted amino acid dehydrogenase
VLRSTISGRFPLDRTFVRGEGVHLHDDQGVRYLDALAEHGALPFGHNPRAIWQALDDVREHALPWLAHPSTAGGATALADLLLELAPPGLRFATFARSRAEAVESAIHACRLSSGRHTVVTTTNAFHGGTLEAAASPERPVQRRAKSHPAPDFIEVAFGSAALIGDTLAANRGAIAAVLVEPIQGEGGVVEPAPGYLHELRVLCDQHDVRLIIDEAETGLGRTGVMFACTAEAVTPDCLIVSDALGGGLVPCAACLHTERAYSEDFARQHATNFAAGAVAAHAGVATLTCLTAKDGALLRHARRMGARLRRGLDKLKLDHPQSMAAVRGRGLMLGLVLAAPAGMIRARRGALLEILAKARALAPFVASYLLNVHRVRVAPALHQLDVIRIQPPLVIDEAGCDELLGAIRAAVERLTLGETAGLMAHLHAGTSASVPARAPKRRPRAAQIEPRPNEGRFAFIVHLLDGRSLRDVDDALAHLSDDSLERLATRFERLGQPLALARSRITSPTGTSAVGDFICLPFTARQLTALSPSEAQALVGAAIGLARDRGAGIVGLGGYTSIVSRGIRPLLEHGVALTTGNSYTVISAIDAVFAAAEKVGQPIDQLRASIMGGAGSIGSAIACLLAEKVASLTLVGRPQDPALATARFTRLVIRLLRHLRKTQAAGARFATDSLAARLLSIATLSQVDRFTGPACAFDTAAQSWVEHSLRGIPLRWGADLPAAIADADLIVLATSSPDELVRPAMVKPGAVLCDLSRPPNVSAAMPQERPDVVVIDGGVVAVPGLPDLGFGFGFPKGLAYACMAETMMLGLEQHYEHTSLAQELDDDTLTLMRRLATKHGFALADLRQGGRPIAATSWATAREMALAARHKALAAAATKLSA